MRRRCVSPVRPSVRLFSSDPPSNLRLKVTLKKSRHQQDCVNDASNRTQKAALLHRKKLENQQLQKNLERIDAGDGGGGGGRDDAGDQEVQSEEQMMLPQLKEVVLEKVFYWQEKVHSPREILRLCHPKHRKSSHLDNQYEFEIRKLLDRVNDDPEAASRAYVLAQSGVMLCSMIDVDDYVHPSMLEENVTTSSNKELNPVAKRLECDRAHSKRARDINYQSMTLLAAVDLPDNESDMKHLKKAQSAGMEKILCRIRLFDNSSLVMEPDFNGSPTESAPYEFRSAKGVWYDYWIENVSEGSQGDLQPSLQEQEQERRRIAQMKDRQQNLFGAKLSWRPPASKIQLNVFGEIMRVSDVDASDTYVMYELSLPEGWMWSTNDPLRRSASITPTSKAVVYNHCEKKTRVSHFSFPFEFELMGRRDAPTFRMPTFYFQVNSTDFWGREHVQGYGYAQVPSIPGMHELTIQLWKPTGTIADVRKDFFLGCVPSLQSIWQSGLPPDSQKRFEARYGMATRSSGELQIRINTLLTPGQTEKMKPKSPQKKLALTIQAAGSKGGGAGRSGRDIFRAIEELRISAREKGLHSIPRREQVDKTKTIVHTSDAVGQKPHGTH